MRNIHILSRNWGWLIEFTTSKYWWFVWFCTIIKCNNNMKEEENLIKWHVKPFRVLVFFFLIHPGTQLLLTPLCFSIYDMLSFLLKVLNRKMQSTLTLFVIFEFVINTAWHNGVVFIFNKLYSFIPLCFCERILLDWFFFFNVCANHIYMFMMVLSERPFSVFYLLFTFFHVSICWVPIKL